MILLLLYLQEGLKVDSVDCLIAFGSNLGDPSSIYDEALNRLGELSQTELVASSRSIQTRPVGTPHGQSDYLNAAIRLSTSLAADELFHQLTEIEFELGRERRQRWGARKIDLDLLLCDNVILETDSLTIPHPRMSFRRFVLEPANEIAPEMWHPVSLMTIGELIDHLNQAPNEIVWFSAINETMRSTRDEILSQAGAENWKLHLIDQPAEFEQLQCRTKLVVWGADIPESHQKLSFRGPQMKLKAQDDIATEILAAMEAMRPMDGSG